jgi:hypothetical protein
MTKDSFAEFPPISKQSVPISKPWTMEDSSDFSIDPEGHLLLKHEGSNYKVLYLGQTRDPDLVF